ILFFFFSSRRRHTRWNCDWSSDVCSSDLKNLVVVEAPSHLYQYFRHRHHAGIGFCARRRAIINAAVGVNHPLVVMSGTVGQEASVEGLPHAFGGGEMTAGPAVAVMRTGVRRQRREQAE